MKTVEMFDVKPGAKSWLVRGKKIALNLTKKETLLPVQDVARLVIEKESEWFRATDEELYKSIPRELKKVLVLNEWHHRQFYRDREEIYGEAPGSYETWHQIAKVIVTGDIEYYKPVLKPNTHWKFHPESGSL